MNTAVGLADRYPGTFFLNPDDLPAIAHYLQSRDWIKPQEIVYRAEPAGEGNMNCTLRIHASERSFVLKQARPWVEKYPHIPAPCSRAEMEARFYTTVITNSHTAQHMPKLLGYDSRERVLMLEDLGVALDFTLLYGETTASFDEADFTVLTHYLIALHGAFRDRQRMEDFLNAEMRALNHQHIFTFPLRVGNGLSLDSITPGLGALAEQLQSDSLYVEEVRTLGECYLDHSHGTCLIHGDYFPGSWLKARGKVYVIDPEFCFFGAPELDLGMMVGHLYLSEVSEEVIENVLKLYSSRACINASLALQFAGVEIMRRLIGVAQFPLRYGLPEKRRLLELSRRLVLN